MRALIGALVVGLLRSRPGQRLSPVYPQALRRHVVGTAFSLVAILACLFVALSVGAPVNMQFHYRTA
jgi:hypothetical protein